MSKTLSSPTPCPIGERFLAILPTLQLSFRVAFRHVHGDQREDALQEATANAFAAFVQLWRRGKADAALPTPLDRYAVLHWYAGRRVGMTMNGTDVLSGYAQRRNGIQVTRLQRYQAASQTWRELDLEDRRTPVPDQAAFRIDFPAWLGQLSRRNRVAALLLADGATTQEVSRRLKLSPARVSQLRREFQASWSQFHGEGCPVAAAS